MTQISQHDWEQSIQWVSLVVGCVIRHSGKYLLVQKKQEKAYGLWNLPAGHVDKDEPLIEAAIRETKEETGYSVEILSEVGIYHHEAQAAVKHAYEAKIIGGKPIVINEEILQLGWFTFPEIERLHSENKIRAEWVWQAIEEHNEK